MNREERLIDKFGRDPGYRVPEGYFDDFVKKMQNDLPSVPERPREVKPSLWVRVRPYLYMAAMFAGIWLMMNIFHRVSSNNELNLDRMPENVSQAIASVDNPDFYLPGTIDRMNEFVLLDEVSADYSNIEEFEADFMQSYNN